MKKIVPLFFLMLFATFGVCQTDTKNSVVKNLLYVQNTISSEDDGLNISSPFELKKIHIKFYNRDGGLVFTSDSIQPRFSKEYMLNVQTDSSGKITAMKNLHYYVVPWSSGDFSEGVYFWEISYSTEAKEVSGKHEEYGKTYLLK